MLEKRTLIQNTVQLYEESLILKNYLSKIIDVLKASDKSPLEIHNNLKEIKRDFDVKNIKLLKDYEFNINSYIIDIDMMFDEVEVNIDIQFFIDYFQELLAEINMVISIFNSENVKKAKSEIKN